MATRDLALVTEIDAQNAVLGDLAVSGTSLLDVTDADAVTQECNVVLRWWRGEWFLDQTLGTPYLEEVLKRGVTEPSVAAVLARELERVPDLAPQPIITVTIDRATRRMTADVEGQTVDGEAVEAGV